MVALALDTGTKTGWALARRGGAVGSGVWDLSRGPGRPYHCRGLNLWEKLEQMHEAHGITLLVWEEVWAHPRKGGETNIAAAHVYGGLVMVASMWAEWKGIATKTVAVATIKKHATGKGNAKKDAIVAAAQKKWPEQNVCDDNQADALWILDCIRSGT